ncbi:glyoxalase superfamily protein [Paenibacillus sp. GCM10012307]|uniref:Bleomycin resistance protein n=1 Tax=Paenibacillus roseus TaxID=2798579 RepID=A0A934MR03_9BACL|nr:glyoxalase superfamily protein [Paenibacillus roseus]MBJ6362408.1 VOC family protein [Paenibacillus roseus]
MSQQVTPIFRMFDEQKAKEYYLDFLGFQLDWEHRFEENFPLYMQISRDQLILHLSEHYGDCSPGSAIRISIPDLDVFHEALLAKQYKYSRPGIENTPWEIREMNLTDPFGNRLVFYEERMSES